MAGYMNNGGGYCNPYPSVSTGYPNYAQMQQMQSYQQMQQPQPQQTNGSNHHDSIACLNGDDYIGKVLTHTNT